MPAPQRIKDLVEKFTANISTYKSKDYLEEDLRNNFLNLFFQELGWDMEDKAGKGALRDLHYEKNIKSGAPDYGFYTDRKLRFFVEAKNPSVDVCNNQATALQLRGYGWSAKVPRCILTDFEELSIYDTTVKPKPSDQAHVARMGGTCIKYTEFVERWDEITAIFSREAVMAGSFEKLEEMHANQAVDKELLIDISRWREMLAKNIANRNEVTEERLNRIVQDTVSRILFLRICEDRGIAHKGDLSEVTEGVGVYAKLYKLFKKAEKRYDSDLFEVASIEGLVIDDSVLKDVISELYFPKSPYKFDAIPAEILGQVYEQFLGKVIRLTEGGHAKVEEKPEVRKAGGIYYTPTYIVEYIVRNTVGKLIEGKTPKKIETLSIVDPACGSGSFLLGAYKFLADWYRDWYAADNATKHEKAKKIYRDANKQWQLTLEERKRILTTHIYGVDIDRQAVELTKLSLMLEALRAPEQKSLFNDRMLPRLSENIKCGNSLIGTDYFTDQLTPDPSEMMRINAFDWATEFNDIFKRGGFTAVIGNPPYIFTREQISDTERHYYTNHYKLSWEKQNTFMLFMELLLRITDESGRGGYIVPNSWLTIESGKLLRERLVGRLELVADLNYPVFHKVAMEPSIFIALGRNTKSDVIVFRARTKDEFFTAIPTTIQRSTWSGTGFRIVLASSADLTRLLEKVRKNSDPIESRFIVKTGLQAYEQGKGNPRQSKQDVKDHVFDRSAREDQNSIRYLEGQDVGRYYLNWSGLWMQYGPWLSQPREIGIFTRPRLLLREITSPLPRCLNASFVTDQYLNNKSILIVLHQDDSVDDLKTLTCILNSKLLSVFYKNHAVKGARKIFPKVVIKNLREFPFPKNINDETTQVFAPLADTISMLRGSLKSTKSIQEKIVIQRQIDATDQQIDQFVYKLYGLTDEEIRIVEGTKK